MVVALSATSSVFAQAKPEDAIEVVQPPVVAQAPAEPVAAPPVSEPTPPPLVEQPAPPLVVEQPAPPPPVVIPPPKIALVLGGGAAKGFAHIGVIKALESQGIFPDLVVGTSAGAVVGVLWASGYDGFSLQRIAMEMKESNFSDWSLPNRGFFKGESIRDFVNQKVQRRPLEKLKRTVGVVATDLQSGELIVFQRGDAGIAVQASTSVPGVFQPVTISGREYVDGGVVSPVPVKVARRLGADIVIAVNISDRAVLKSVKDIIDVLLQTFTIMGAAIARNELAEADVIVQPDITHLNSTDFESRHLAVLEGERAGYRAIPALRQKIADREARLRAVTHPAPR
ncbi:MAG: patatin-like phospholipase family protein [Betaproteobacteria bacterium]|nr:patatin-like phospholipase family protein [Betaproteobacteria bacterium]